MVYLYSTSRVYFRTSFSRDIFAVISCPALQSIYCPAWLYSQFSVVSSFVLLLLLLLEKWEYNDAVRQLFIDFKKAHDLVRKEFLYDILIEICIPKKLVGATRWRVWLSGWGIVLQAARSRVQFPKVVFRIFHWKSCRSPYGSEVDLNSDGNECQEHLLGCKGSRCVRLTTLQPSCAHCLEILEPHSTGKISI